MWVTDRRGWMSNVPGAPVAWNEPPVGLRSYWSGRENVVTGRGRENTSRRTSDRRDGDVFRPSYGAAAHLPTTNAHGRRDRGR